MATVQNTAEGTTDLIISNAQLWSPTRHTAPKRWLRTQLALRMSKYPEDVILVS